uniref:Peptidase S1 domain-containing protein n=1 Tax=Lygus hesperus TaxID=30085 RepID=A0A0K8T513_LYGHE
MADKGRITETIMKPNDVKCVAMGWGAIEDDTAPVAFLNKINMTLKPLDWCSKTAKELTKDFPVPNEFNSEIQTCALGTGNNQSVCGGDSGGPIVCGGEGKKIIVAVLTGIVLKNCGYDTNPALLARLDFALDWILDAFPPTTSGTTTINPNTISPTHPPAHSCVSYITISFAYTFPLMFCVIQNILRYLQ